MRKKGIAVFCGLAVLFSILFGGFPQKWQVSAAADMTNFAEEAAALTNQFRQENGLPGVTAGTGTVRFIGTACGRTVADLRTQPTGRAGMVQRH